MSRKRSLESFHKASTVHHLQLSAVSSKTQGRTSHVDLDQRCDITTGSHRTGGCRADGPVPVVTVPVPRWLRYRDRYRCKYRLPCRRHTPSHLSRPQPAEHGAAYSQSVRSAPRMPYTSCPHPARMLARRLAARFPGRLSALRSRSPCCISRPARGARTRTRSVCVAPPVSLPLPALTATRPHGHSRPLAAARDHLPPATP